MLPRSLICLYLGCMALFGQPPAAEPNIGLHENQPDVFALTGVTLYKTPTQKLENATLVIRNGVVESAGVNVTPPEDAVVIAMTGRTVYPGFIDLYSDYGMPKPTRSRSRGNDSDKGETEPPGSHWNKKVTPQKRAAEVIESSEKTLKELRQAGFTAVVSHPQTGIFRGSGALVLLGDGEPGSWILDAQTAQSVNLGDRSRRDYPGSLMGAMALFRQTMMDAAWYQRAWSVYKNNPKGQVQPETNHALAALSEVANGQQAVVFQSQDEWDILAASRLASEFKLNYWVVDAGNAYRRAQAIRDAGARLIISVDFPEAPEVSEPESEQEISLQEMKHWYFAPTNAQHLAKAGVPFVLSSSGVEKAGDILKNLRQIAERGMPEQAILTALTTTPAAWLKQGDMLGNLAPGAYANFIVTSGPIFEKDSDILETWVRGQRHSHKDLPDHDLRGTYELSMEGSDTKHALELSGKPEKLSGKLGEGENEAKLAKIDQDGIDLHFTLPGKAMGESGTLRAKAMLVGKDLLGHFYLANGRKAAFKAAYQGPADKKSDKGKDKDEKKSDLDLPMAYPDGIYGRETAPEQPKTLLIRNATIWTAGPDNTIEGADMLVEGGKIKAVGKGLKAGRKATVIDATGKHVTPGLIDAHSHTAIRGGVNEGTHSITAEVRIEDVLDPDDINIYRQLAGGLTMGNQLHGSANAIGGQNAVSKWRWGATAEEMLFDGAMPGIKFALGENVKQSNWGEDFTTRYPQTRMGVEQFFRDAFMAAKAYRAEWEAYEAAANKANLIPPRKVLTHETLLEILDGKRQIHCHSYRQDEILALIRVAEDIGFKVDTFTHILEGYKVAEAMASHGAMGSTFSDWWAYKMEVADAIPYNGALMHDNGVIVSFKSDSNELARRLNTEAAKAIKYGGVSPEEAIRFVTLNPAKQLRIEDRVGSLEAGKDADFVIWSEQPLSSYARCEQTWIDGRKYFDIQQDQKAREEANRQRNLLVQRILESDGGQGKPGKGARGRRMQDNHTHDHGHGADDEENHR